MDELVPVTGDSLNQASQLLEAQSIVYCPDVEIDPVYTVVSALNLSDCQQPANTKAVLGSADEIYMSKDNLYLAGSSDGSSTNLVRVAVEDSDIHFAATGKVPGQVLGQFSMDERRRVLPGGIHQLFRQRHSEQPVCTGSIVEAGGQRRGPRPRRKHQNRSVTWGIPPMWSPSGRWIPSSPLTFPHPASQKCWAS